MKGQASEEDIVRGGWVLSITLGLANGSCPSNLNTRSNNITCNEKPEDHFGGQRGEAAGVGVSLNQDAEDRVYGGREEDRRYDDEKVLDDKVDDVVWVFLCSTIFGC